VLLVVQGGTALASSDTSTTSTILETSDDLGLNNQAIDQGVQIEEPTVVEEAIAQEANEPPVEDVLAVQAETDDDPDGDASGEVHFSEGCGGEFDPARFQAKIELAASILGLTVEQITSQVESGMRLFEIAAVQGHDMEAFKQTIHSTLGEDGCACGTH
jgi:hypothetical protein